jgi:hypothetical protein
MAGRGGPSASYWWVQAGILLVGAVLALVTAHYYATLILVVLATPACKQAIDKGRVS